MVEDVRSQGKESAEGRFVVFVFGGAGDEVVAEEFVGVGKVVG